MEFARVDQWQSRGLIRLEGLFSQFFPTLPKAVFRGEAAF
jgi:hypothetical protein